MLLKQSAFIAVLAILMPVLAASAQERVPLPLNTGKMSPTELPGHWCATPSHMHSAEGQAALERFHEARANGTLPRVSKSQAAYEIGQLEGFNIITDSAWVPATFELKATGTRFNIWLRTDDPTQLAVTDERIEEFRKALEEETPFGSLDPTKGVMEIDELVFGEAPIYPVGSDGVVDILVYHLATGVAGFVSPRDVDPAAESGEGNQREVLHLWVDGFFRVTDSRIESVAAHEYQHLIHLNYDPREIQFVNEGLSEYAQLLLGYQAIIPLHLLLSPQPEYNIPLFSWRNGEDAVILDYTRGSTWHGYLGDQLGPELTGSITRHPQIGLEGYKQVLADAGSDKTIAELILDFYTALIVNDLNVDPRFGIKDPVRTGQIDIQLPSDRRFGRNTSTEANLDTLVIQPGGTEYFAWSNVSDLVFTFDVKAGPDLIEARRQHLRVRVIAEPISGDMEFIDFLPSPDIHMIEGSFKKVTVVAANVRPEVLPTPAFLHSSWSSDAQVVSYAYGQDIPYTGAPFTMADGPDAAFAVRFPVPPGGVLNDAELGVFHLSQFIGPATATRDYLFTVWDNGGGRPGDVIYSEVYENPNPAQIVQVRGYDWQEFSFSPAIGKGEALPDTVYIGAREVGGDENYMIVWPATVNFQAFPRAPFDTGYIGGLDDLGNRQWVPSWEVTFEGDPPDDRPLRSTALPVRARFVIDPTLVAVEETGELPLSIQLDQNFPNPFNPSTRITFALPAAVDVDLSVFDMTGREVATLAEGPRPAGTYNVTLNASNWASGMYVYRLQAGDQHVVKRMVLLK